MDFYSRVMNPRTRGLRKMRDDHHRELAEHSWRLFVSLLQASSPEHRRSLTSKLVEVLDPLLTGIVRSKIDRSDRVLHDSGDLVQSIWERLLPRVEAASFRPPENTAQFMALIRKIILNDIADRRRRRALHPERHFESVFDSNNPLNDDAESPLGHVAATQDHATVWMAIQMLAEESRLLVVGRVFEGKTWAVLGAELGISDVAAGQRWATVQVELAHKIGVIRNRGPWPLLDQDAG